MQRVSLLLFSALCLLLLLVHLLNPGVTFDMPSLVLLFLGVLPWLAALFKELEVPGIGRFVFRDRKKKVTRRTKRKPRRRRRHRNIQIIVDDQ